MLHANIIDTAMNRLLLSLLPLALAACASAPAPAPASQEVALAPMDPDTICERESSTGTNLPKKRCRSPEQRKADQDAVKQAEESRRNFQGMTTGK